MRSTEKAPTLDVPKFIFEDNPIRVNASKDRSLEPRLALLAWEGNVWICTSDLLQNQVHMLHLYINL